MHGHSPLQPRRSERGVSLLEVIIVIAIVAILTAILASTLLGAKTTSREKVTQSHMQEARSAMQRLRDREQATLRVLLGAGSHAACASGGTLPAVEQLSSGCRAAWEAVNAALVPVVGSIEASQRMMTDAAGRPLLVETREVGCPGTELDRVIAVHPSGAWAKPTQELTLPSSRYDC